MRRFISAVVLTGGLSATLWLTLSPATPNVVATCEVGFSEAGYAWMIDAGYVLARREEVRFGAHNIVLADGGVEFEAPARLGELLAEVPEDAWIGCRLDDCAVYPDRCTQAAWESLVPLEVIRAERRCVRRKEDAGFGSCTLVDGGEPDGWPCNDGCNVFPAAAYSDPTAPGCERVACSVLAGESALRSLDDGEN